MTAKVARRLADSSTDVLAAVVLDAAADRPIEQIEVQTTGGSVYAVRDARHEIVCVTRRGALPALVLYDIHDALRKLAPA